MKATEARKRVETEARIAVASHRERGLSALVLVTIGVIENIIYLGRNKPRACLCNYRERKKGLVLVKPFRNKTKMSCCGNYYLNNLNKKMKEATIDQEPACLCDYNIRKGKRACFS